MRNFQRAAAIGALVLCGAGRAGAQDPPTEPPVAPFTNVFVAIGTAYTNIGNLNQRFDTTRFDALSGHGFSIGGGGYIPWGRALFGGEYHSTDFGFEDNAAGRTNKMSGAYWMATAGLALYTSWQFNIVGVLGVGQGSLKLVVSDRNGGATVGNAGNPFFDDILSNPGSSSTINGSYTIVQPAIGVDYLMLRSDQSHVGVTFGIRIGTSISPHLTDWTYQGRSVVNGPDAGPVGTFFRLTIGIGGFKLVPR